MKLCVFNYVYTYVVKYKHMDKKAISQSRGWLPLGRQGEKQCWE
jgi:hypothetical protein